MVVNHSNDVVTDIVGYTACVIHFEMYFRSFLFQWRNRGIQKRDNSLYFSRCEIPFFSFQFSLLTKNVNKFPFNSKTKKI